MNTLLLFAAVFGTASAHATPWNAINDPSQMNANYNYKFDQLPLKGRVSESHMPWSDNYWESDWGGISFRWNTVSEGQRDPDPSAPDMPNKANLFKYVPPTKAQVAQMSKADLMNLSPAEKYDILMGRFDYPTVQAERKRVSPKDDSWHGLCHGWVPAAINHSEPQPTELTGATGIVVPFGSADLKGLLDYYYGVTAYDYARGYRSTVRTGDTLSLIDMVDSFDVVKLIKAATLRVTNNDEPVDIEALKDASACTTAACLESMAADGYVDSLAVVSQLGATIEKKGKFSGVKNLQDPNPGAFYVMMTNQLALLDRAYVEEVTQKLKKGEIWNQPVVGFETTVNGTKMLAGGARKVSVTTKLIYVTESPQTWAPIMGTDKQRYDDMTFDYTVDVNSSGYVTGGDWQDKKYHPGFAWTHAKLQIRGYFSRLNEMVK